MRETAGHGADSAGLAERTLDTAAAITGAERAALFVREVHRLALFASRGIDQTGLDAIARAWASRHGDLEAGRSVVEAAHGGTTAVVPVTEDRLLLGVLYLEADEPGRFGDREQDLLNQIARVAAVALSMPAAPLTASVDAFLARRGDNEIARRQLLVLLEQHEWNISRVARACGVTRVTVYRWLERFGIERRKVRVTSGPAHPAEIPRRV
jgi:hypothetical protein